MIAVVSHIVKYSCGKTNNTKKVKIKEARGHKITHRILF